MAKLLDLAGLAYYDSLLNKKLSAYVKTNKLEEALSGLGTVLMFAGVTNGQPSYDSSQDVDGMVKVDATTGKEWLCNDGAWIAIGDEKSWATADHNHTGVYEAKGNAKTKVDALNVNGYAQATKNADDSFSVSGIQEVDGLISASGSVKITLSDLGGQPEGDYEATGTAQGLINNLKDASNGYAQATKNADKSVSVVGIQEVDGIISASGSVKITLDDLGGLVSGNYETEGTAQGLINGLNADGYDQVTKSNKTVTIKGIKEVDGVISHDNTKDVSFSLSDLNGQAALDSQTAFSSKGDATKVPQITTNSLGLVTAVGEVEISHPSQVTNTASQTPSTTLAMSEALANNTFATKDEVNSKNASIESNDEDFAVFTDYRDNDLVVDVRYAQFSQPSTNNGGTTTQKGILISDNIATNTDIMTLFGIES